MNAFRALLLAAAILTGSVWDSGAAGYEIKKVLPHFLDAQGRHTLAPSLYERDAYQAQLRKTREVRAGMRFDILWKAAHHQPTTIRIEMRGIANKQTTHVNFETNQMPRRLMAKWSSLVLPKETYQQLGELTAWKVTLIRNDEVLAEEKSFLW